MGLVNSLENPPRIAINDFFLGDFSKAHRPEVVEALQSSPTIRSLNCRPIMQDGLSDGNVIPKLQHIWRTVSFCRHLQSLTLTFLPCSPHLRAPWISKSNSSKWDGNCRHILLPIRELHIDGWLNLPEGNTQDGLEFLKAVPWPSIKKMTLSGDLVGVTLPRFGDELVSLRSLCLRSGVRSDSKNALPAVSNFLATKPLVELELDGFSNDLSIEVIANAQLRKLRLHTWETAYLGGPSRLRPAKDIRKCAELAPNLEHFMLDVARVGKLWHPTAIPGVDVDVQVYQILDALSRFSRLKILHLFPRFHSGNGSHPGMWKQAMEDEAQAVRIFRHMKSIQPRLELLVISSDNIVATLNEIDPMSWTVCSFGDYILVRVWQANKDYEQRQIWQGQRRLRTETKRYPYPEVYLSGVGPRLRRRRQL